MDVIQVEEEETKFFREVLRPHEQIREHRSTVKRRLTICRVRSWMTEHLDQLRSLADRRMKTVTEKGWFQRNFSKEVHDIYQEITLDKGLETIWSLPLAEQYRRFKPMFRYDRVLEKKLMLRDDTEFAEAPDLLFIDHVKTTVDAPEGTVIDPSAKMYTMDAKDITFCRKNQYLQVSAVFKFTDNVTKKDQKYRVKMKLDALMSHPKYAKSCRDAFDKQIVQPLIERHSTLFKTEERYLQQALQSGANIEQDMQSLFYIQPHYMLVSTPETAVVTS